MHLFLVYTILGLVTGSVYGIAASGLVLTYTTSGIFNFAHGEFVLLGAYAVYFIHGLGAPVWLGMALAPVVVFVIGLVVGSVLGASFLGGVPVGPLFAAGLTYAALELWHVFFR